MDIEKKIREFEVSFAKISTFLIILRHVFLAGLNIVFKEYIHLTLDIIVLLLITPSFVFIFYTSNFNFIRLGKITSYLYLTLLILYCSVYYVENITIILLYIFLFPIGFLLFFDFKKTFFLLASIMLIFPIDYTINYFFNIERSFTGLYLEYLNIFTVFFSLILFFCYLYYFVQINRLKTICNYIANNEVIIDGFFYIPARSYRIKSNNILNKINDLPANESTYSLLFEKIERHMTINQPWKSSEYSLQQLAKEMNSNHLYVSFAINKYSKKNFKTYLNEYRLAAFTEYVKGKDNEQLLLKEIYLNIGFDNQATFNRVFKSKFFMTPQEYMEQIKK